MMFLAWDAGEGWVREGAEEGVSSVRLPLWHKCGHPLLCKVVAFARACLFPNTCLHWSRHTKPAAVLGSSGSGLLGGADGAIVDPLAALRQAANPAVAPLLDFFTFLAIATSFIGFVLGLSDFIADALKASPPGQASCGPLAANHPAKACLLSHAEPSDLHMALADATSFGNFPCCSCPRAASRSPTCSRWCRPWCWRCPSR